MDLPDPAELWNYRTRLQRAGFRSDEAVRIVEAAITGTVRSEFVVQLDIWANDVLVEQPKAEHPEGANALRCHLEAQGPGDAESVLVRCEPSLAPDSCTYLFVDGGHAFLSLAETITLRNTLTAILEETP